jgi:branched-chain amino acid transport system ATP-binding protein
MRALVLHRETNACGDVLTLERLTKVFGGLLAVKGVSFRVEAASITGLIGPNGSGKTVTFDCITGFCRLDAGRVHLEGRDITGRRPPEVARAGIARSFQITGNFPRLTVEENLAFAAQRKRLPEFLAGHGSAEARRAASARIDPVLALIGLESVRDRPVASLAYGQQKILEFASLVVMEPEPRLYLLDEPFAGLTVEEIGRYLSLVQDLRRRGKTFLVVEHNMRVVMEICDRLVVLDHGEKIAEGRPDAIRTDARVIEAYLGHGAAARRS